MQTSEMQHDDINPQVLNRIKAMDWNKWIAYAITPHRVADEKLPSMKHHPALYAWLIYGQN